VVRIPVRSWEWIARVVAGHGADAIVLSPTELRDIVVGTLSVSAHRAPTDAVSPGSSS
jgi:proteasome accessory factor B